MTEQKFSLIAGIVFALVALAHLARVAHDWPIIIGTHIIPLWVSWLGLVVSSALAYLGLYYGTRK